LLVNTSPQCARLHRAELGEERLQQEFVTDVELTVGAEQQDLAAGASGWMVGSVVHGFEDTDEPQP